MWGDILPWALAAALFVAILWGVTEFWAPGAIADALGVPTEEALPIAPEGQAPIIDHGIVLASQPLTSVMMGVDRFMICPSRGLTISVYRSELTSEQDAYLRSRV